MKTIKNNTSPTIKLLIAASLMITLLAMNSQAQTIDDYIKILGPANYSCFGYQPTCMDKTIQLCNKDTSPTAIDKNTFRYDFGRTENLERITLNKQTNNIITTLEETDYNDISCSKLVRNNLTSNLEEKPAPCTRTQTTTTPNLTKIPLAIDSNGRFADTINMQPNACVNITLRPALSENQRAQGAIEYNITFLGHLLDPFVNKYNLTQDFNDTTEINTTSPTQYNAHILNGTLFGNWTNNITYTNRTDPITPWNCTSTAPVEPTGAGCQGAYDQQCGSDAVTKEWIMNCGGYCHGATLMIDIGREATLYGMEWQVNNNGAISYYEVYVSSNPYPNGLNTITCSAGQCSTNFENLTQDLVMNTTNATTWNTNCANTTLNFTPKTGRYIYLRTWSSVGGVNPRIGEIRPLIINFTDPSKTASITYNLSQNISNVKFAINQTLFGGTVGFNLSCDGTTNWCEGGSTNDGGTINCCGTTKNDAITYTLAITGTSNYLRPTINRLNLEAFNGTTGGASATEEQARTAIENGIKEVFPTATIATDQLIYLRYTNGTQRYSRADKYFSNANKGWIFNYLNTTDTTIAMSNLSTNLYIWEGQTLTNTQIQQYTRELVNQTK